MKRFVLAAIASLAITGSALAQECTEELAAEKSEALFALINSDPAKAEKMEESVATVEAHYGGEPNEAQTCEALDMLMGLLNETE